MSICNAKKYKIADYKSLYSRYSDFKSEWTENGRKMDEEFKFCNLVF